MKKYSLIILLCAFAACTEEQPVLTDRDTAAERSHAIPEEDAISSLEQYLALSDNSPTKSSTNRQRRIGSISIIRNRQLPTRSTELTSMKCDSLVYLVNFEDGEGYALLAADDRISSEIILVTDNGSLAEETLCKAFELSERTIYPEFPIEGEGIIREVTDSTEELFINPNTFQLYDESEDDSFVGSYIPDEELEDFEDTTETVSVRSLSEQSEPELPAKTLVNNLSLTYCIDEIKGYESITADADLAKRKVDPETSETKTVKTTKEALDVKVDKLLSFAKYWSQGTPFNDDCPKVRKYVIFGKRKRADCGCVPLAIAKIMAAHEYPGSVTYNGTNINWTELKADSLPSALSASGKKSAAALTRMIGADCNSLYFYGGTFTFPNKAASFLRECAYPEVEFKDYDSDRVVAALDNGCPVFICSVPAQGFFNYSLKNSHGWNIDGYQIRTRETTTAYYVNGIRTKTETTTKSTVMVHCDFGWAGYCNGYFTSGIFKLGSSDVQYDNQNDKGKENTNYKWYLKTITYDNPN